MINESESDLESMKPTLKEIESTLAICSENPQEIMKQVTNITSILDYQLIDKGSISFYDIFFDTFDMKLDQIKMVLRIRKIELNNLITLKGPSKKSELSDYVERFEFESEWSHDSLNQILKELEDNGIIISSKCDYLDNDPIKTISDLGLNIVQERKCQRTIRDVTTAGEESETVFAELAIDHIMYHLNDHQVFHNEIEVEIKKDGNIFVMKEIIEHLIKMYPSELRRWDYGKFATGKAIEKLLSNKTINKLIDDKNNLMPVVYDLLAKYLNDQSIGKVKYGTVGYEMRL